MTDVRNAATVQLEDVQGLVRGFGRRYLAARHFFLGVADPAGAREFVGAIADGAWGPRLQVTTAAERAPEERPQTCLNIGITWPGLRELGVAAGVLDQFPQAFQQGPAARAAVDPTKPNDVGLGDVGESAPERWTIGGPNAPEVHFVLSLYVQDPALRDEVEDELAAKLATHGLTMHCRRDADALPSEHGQRVHFGYRDGIAQPSIIGIPDKHDRPDDLQPLVPTGDVLLGCEYKNSFGGNYAGDLPRELVANATYGAFRILYQDVAAFEQLVQRWAQDAGDDPQLIAAKVMGRWRNGTPLALAPDLVDDQPPEVSPQELNAFDYAPTPEHPDVYNDSQGLRCPIGAHTRRLNPRGAIVMGKPHSRRLVRRNMPYGAELEGTADDGADRGLMGYFLCGDLETQWEFIQRTWVNQDLATHGVRGTREPIGGTQPGGDGTFKIALAKSPRPIVLHGLPDLVRTRGSAYCLLPGIGGLRHLASSPGSNGGTT
jgi:deferrochelatase/peroxidase EfeB